LLILSFAPNPALLDDRACDLIDTFVALKFVKMNGRFMRILSAARFHDLEVCA
jgi:hypothetical protein